MAPLFLCLRTCFPPVFVVEYLDENQNTTMGNDNSQSKKKLFPGLAKPAQEVQTGNVFTSLFDEDKAKSQGTSSVVNSVIKKSDSKESILGPRPKTDNLGIVEKPIAFGNSFLKLVIFLWVVLLAGSYFTLGASFNLGGLNQSSAAEENLTDIKQAQSELNSNNYLVAYYYLDSFAYMADSYLYKKAQYESDYTSSNQKTELEDELAQLEEDLILALQMAQSGLGKSVSPEGVEVKTDIASDVVFKEATSSYLEAEIAKLQENTEDADVKIEIAGLNGALALIKNGAFVKEILSADITSVQEIVNSLSNITEDDFTLISKIKSNRQSWSNIIQKIETITKKIDPLYGTSVQGDINYSSFTFNSGTKTILINGKTLTDDTRNFTLIANLTDTLEQSPLFMNVQERSFSKSESSDEDNTEYEASFKLEFQIQEGEDSRDAVSTLLNTTETKVKNGNALTN